MLGRAAQVPAVSGIPAVQSVQRNGNLPSLAPEQRLVAAETIQGQTRQSREAKKAGRKIGACRRAIRHHFAAETCWLEWSRTGHFRLRENFVNLFCWFATPLADV